jgi:hypothetical protein
MRKAPKKSHAAHRGFNKSAAFSDGQIWRAETELSQFLDGWNHPSVVLYGDIFESSHTYCLKGQDKFLTLIEAQASGRRLDGL